MRLNADCMRAILLEIEKQSLNSNLRLSELKNVISDFESDEV